MKKMAIPLLAVCGLLLTVGITEAVRAGTQQYVFTNNSDPAENRNDLHIEFEQAVRWTPALPAPFTSASTQNQATVDFSGGNVAAGGTVTVTFRTGGTGPTIDTGAGSPLSYWTDDGAQKELLSSANCNPYP